MASVPGAKSQQSNVLPQSPSFMAGVARRGRPRCSPASPEEDEVLVGGVRPGCRTPPMRLLERAPTTRVEVATGGHLPLPGGDRGVDGGEGRRRRAPGRAAALGWYSTVPAGHARQCPPSGAAYAGAAPHVGDDRGGDQRDRRTERERGGLMGSGLPAPGPGARRGSGASAARRRAAAGATRSTPSSGSGRTSGAGPLLRSTRHTPWPSPTGWKRRPVRLEEEHHLLPGDEARRPLDALPEAVHHAAGDEHPQGRRIRAGPGVQPLTTSTTVVIRPHGRALAGDGGDPRLDDAAAGAGECGDVHRHQRRRQRRKCEQEEERRQATRHAPST